MWYMAVSVNWVVFFVDVFVRRAPLFGVYTRPDFF